ncbi:MAG: glucokinase [Woeseiaceae bacterium]
MNILLGDIGGTNTRLLFAKTNGTGWESLYEKNYSSQNYSNLYEVLNNFILEHDIAVSVDAACFAIAGPVENGTVSVTNLPWVVSEKQLKEDLKTPHVKIINDFLAVALGISELNENDFIIVQKGQDSSNRVNSDAAVIGAGTGLGAAHLVWLEDHYHCYTSEVGHAGFAPENTLQSQLLLWMQQKHSHVSLEMLLSGKGLGIIYQFLRETMKFKESSLVMNEMKSKDPAQVITEYALFGDDELCQETLACFVDIYGAAAGNIALHYYPIGELYIAGGIAAKIKNKILSSAFIHAFVNKGLLSSNMKKINIKLIVQDKVGLYGAFVKLKSIYL